MPGSRAVDWPEPWPGWHVLVLEETPSGWKVVCTPHGIVCDSMPTHLAALQAALEHDVATGAFNYGRGFE